MATNTERRGSTLSKPPVKLACLSCRGSRIRCDGKDPCTNCSKKTKACIYTKSNRGGPRVSSKKAAAFTVEQQLSLSKLPTPPIEDQQQEIPQHEITPQQLLQQQMLPQQTQHQHQHQHPDSNFQVPTQSFWDLVSPMIMPGAGLKDLDSDRTFDSIFSGKLNENVADMQISDSLMTHMAMPTTYTPITRAYRNNKEILNAYYIFMHPYFPIMPPPDIPVEVDAPIASEVEDFEPSSPISLALSAVFALVPHPDDIDPKNPESAVLRRRKSYLWAQLAMDAIEMETEILASSISPADALSTEPESFRREQFHSRVPIELESVLAYLVLTIYEYAQRGNIAKMRNRASQAYDSAIRLGLHEGGNQVIDDVFAEARRRAWWMTYICVMQGSIVSSLPPVIQVEYREFRTPIPTIIADHEAWPAYLDAQQLILQCTQYTVALKKALESKADLTHIQFHMEMLDKEVDSLSTRYHWGDNIPSSAPIDTTEFVLARSLKCQAQIKFNSARIKLHRWRAFLDAPIFTKKHCDLDKVKPAENMPSAPSCGCSSTFRSPMSPATSDPSSLSSPSSSIEDPSLFAYFSPTAARTCMGAALRISKAFEGLPYPSPQLGPDMQTPTYLSATSYNFAPRTMPAFACCAMQSSYAMLMLCRKGRDWNGDEGMAELFTGLGRVLGALSNYSIAFEAVEGMRAQVQEAFDGVVKAQQRPSFQAQAMGNWI